MATAKDEPADTTMMRIVHDALRRDLERARVALTRTPPPAPRQRAVLGGQLRWMMAFLDAHHRGEDDGLFPLVHDRDPSAAALLEKIADDHDRVARAVVGVGTATVAYVERGAVDALAAAVDDLIEVLLPHLEREERDFMPIVSGVMTKAEWDAVEKEQNLDGKSVRQLAREGHWLIDEANAADRATILNLVPPVGRYVMLYGFRRSYRRMCRACWGRQRRVQHQNAVAVDVPADIEAVWDVVRDPTRVGEWSHECVGARWIDGARESRPGARFRGRNKQGLFRWGRVCEVVRSEPYELVWRVVPTRFYPDSTEWTLRLSRVESGTRIEQTFRLLKGTWLEPVYATLIPAHRDRTEALKMDLARIGAVAVGARTPTGSVTHAVPS